MQRCENYFNPNYALEIYSFSFFATLELNNAIINQSPLSNSQVPL
jgi:hypothetical protein